jgi:hypothetical protein
LLKKTNVGVTSEGEGFISANLMAPSDIELPPNLTRIPTKSQEKIKEQTERFIAGMNTIY